MSQPKRNRSFHFPRELLLVEIERHCAFSDCRAKNRIGLTKPEAIEYRGFECFRCQRWNDDKLNPLDLPDSWRVGLGDEVSLSRDVRRKPE